VSVVCIPIIIVLIIIGIHGYFTSSPSTLGWVLTFVSILVIGFSLVYFVDRFMVTRLNNKLLTLLELALTLILSTVFLYASRQLDLDLSDSPQDFVLVIQNTGQLESSNLTNKSLFNKEMHSTENIVIVDAIPRNIRLIKRPNRWNGAHYYNRYSLDKYNEVILFSRPDLNISGRISDAFIDSLIESKE